MKNSIMNALMKFFWGILILFSLVLSGCTKESKAKKKGIELAQVEFERQIQEELKNKMTQDHPLYRDLFIFFTHQTEYEVENTLENSEHQYLVIVQVKTLSEPLRWDLENVVQQLTPAQYSKFNFTEALNMIKDQRKKETVQIQKLKIPVRF